MIQALAAQAGQVEPGFAPQIARWAIHLSAQGDLLGVLPLGDLTDKRNKGREFLICPQFTFSQMKAGGTPKAHPFRESAGTIALMGEDSDQPKARGKHAYFWTLIKEAAKQAQSLMPVAHFAAMADSIDALRSMLDVAGVKPAETVTFLVGDSFPLDRDDWHAWWRGVFRTVGAAAVAPTTPPAGTVRCFLTGELVEPTRVFPKVTGLSDVGGMSVGDALLSFKQSSFCSYGFEQSENAAVSELSAKTITAGLNKLISKSSRKLAGTKIVFWFRRDVPAEEDPRAFLFDPPETSEPAAQSRASALLDSIRAGSRPDLADNTYHALTLSGASGRVMVRDWMEGSFEALLSNVNAWFDDLSIVRLKDGTLAPPPKFLTVLLSTVRRSKDVKKDLDRIPAPLAAKMWRVAVRNEPIPAEVHAQVLARFKAIIVCNKEDEPLTPVHAGLLKAFHCRRNRKDDSMRDSLQPSLNNDHPSPAYQCGRLLAVLAALQRAALGDVGAGVVERFYPAASTTPGLVLGRMLRNSQFHISKLRSDRAGLAAWFDQQIAEIVTRIGAQPPRALSLEQQSLFALGYYQQKARPAAQENSKDAGQETNS
jgi:CRISPR-associated protein Csd1